MLSAVTEGAAAMKESTAAEIAATYEDINSDMLPDGRAASDASTKTPWKLIVWDFGPSSSPKGGDVVLVEEPGIEGCGGGGVSVAGGTTATGAVGCGGGLGLCGGGGEVGGDAGGVGGGEGGSVGGGGTGPSTVVIERFTTVSWMLSPPPNCSNEGHRDHELLRIPFE